MLHADDFGILKASSEHHETASISLIADLDASWGSSGHSRGAPGFPLFVRVVRTRGNLETAGAVCCLLAGTTSAVEG